MMTEEAGVGASTGSIHEQMESSPYYPYNLQSGWLPEYGSASMRKYFDMVLGAEREEWARSIEEMNEFIEGNDVIEYLVDSACRENLNIIDSHLESAQGVNIPRINDKDTLLNAFNAILKHAPRFVDDALVGLPFSAIVVRILF